MGVKDKENRTRGGNQNSRQKEQKTQHWYRQSASDQRGKTKTRKMQYQKCQLHNEVWKAEWRSQRQRTSQAERAEKLTDIQKGKVSDNFQEDSFRPMAWAIRRLTRADETVALKMLGKLKEGNLFSDLKKKKDRLETGLQFFKFLVSRVGIFPTMA